MTTPTRLCVRCKKAYNADFDRCPFCGEPGPPKEKPKAPPVKCPHCGRPINASFKECPFCKKLVDSPPVPPPPKFDYTAIAADAVEHNKVFLSLDYSPASVYALDVFFDEIWGTEGYSPNSDNWTPEQGQIAVIMSFGAYFGEVIRRRYNGRWQEDQSQGGNPLWTTVALPSGDHLYVISKMFKRLKNGSADALYPMFLSLRQSLGDHPKADELDSWLMQSSHFEKVKRPDHAIKFYDCALALPLSEADRLRVSGSRRLAEAEAGKMTQVDGAGDTTAPETPEGGPPPDFSAGCDFIKKEVERFGGILNDTPASIGAIDAWLELIETNGQPLKSESELRFSQREWSVGCYIGELLCKKFGGSWKADQREHRKSSVVWPDGIEFFPFACYSKRAEQGKEQAIFKQFQEIVSLLRERGKAPPPRDESAEWMEQAEMLASKRDRIDVAAWFARKALQFKPGSAAILVRLGDLTAGMKGQQGNAILWYDKALMADLSHAAAWLGKGRILHSLGRSAEALTCLERIYDRSSRDIHLHLLMADALKGAGRFDDAFETYKLAISLDEKLVPAWLGVAACLESAGSLEEAVETLAKAATMHGSTAEASFHKGELEERLGRVNDAVASYNTANYRAGSDESLRNRVRARLEALENTPERLKLKAEDLAGAGNMQGAIEIYRRILQMTPDNAEAWGEAGTGFSLMGDIDSALYHFDKAISLDPKMVKNWDHKAVSLARVKRLPEALQVLERGLADNPGNPQLLKRKGIFLSMSGDQEGAIRTFDEGLKSDPGNYDIRLFRADVLRIAGRVGESLAELKELCSLAPGWSGKSAMEARRLIWIMENPTASLNPDLGRQYGDRAWNRMIQGDLAGALADYDEGLTADPFNGENWLNKGTTLSHMGRAEESLPCFDRAYDLLGNVHPILQNKGNVLRGLGRFEEALECYETVLGSNPKEEKCLRGKAYALGALGRHEGALDAWNDCLALQPGDTEALERKANCLRELKRLDEAILIYDGLIASDPGNMKHIMAKSLVLFDMGRDDEALELQNMAFSDEKFSKEWNEQGKKLLDLFRGEDDGPVQ